MQAVVYSRDNCQWCDRVKHLLKTVKIDFVEYKYDQDFTKHEFQEEFGSDATFPQVQIENHYIGGVRRLYNGYKEKKSYEEL